MQKIVPEWTRIGGRCYGPFVFSNKKSNIGLDLGLLKEKFSA